MSAKRETFDGDVEQLPEGFLRCRDVGHRWKLASNWKRNTGSFGFVRVLRCTSCKQERRDIAGASGKVISQPRRYPPGYLRSTQSEPLAKADYRVESLRRAGVDLDAADLEDEA